MRSLKNSPASGTRNAARLLENCAPPKSAMAAMGVKLGGCGINLEAAAARIIAARTASRGLFIFFFLVDGWSKAFQLLSGSKSQNQKPFVRRGPAGQTWDELESLGWVASTGR